MSLGQVMGLLHNEETSMQSKYTTTTDLVQPAGIASLKNTANQIMKTFNGHLNCPLSRAGSGQGCRQWEWWPGRSIIGLALRVLIKFPK